MPRLLSFLATRRFRARANPHAIQEAAMTSRRTVGARTPSEDFVTTPDGTRLFFQRVGDGPRTVLVPNGIDLMEDFSPLAEGRTLVFYDLRYRGRSGGLGDHGAQARGIHDDVDDLEHVRRHFGDQVDLIGHSYVGLMVMLYAVKHPSRVHRAVQIGPSPPDHRKQYPAHLTNADATLHRVLAQLAALQQERQAHDPVEFCRMTWSLLAPLFVVDPADADKIRWGRCDLPNERRFMSYWTEILLPSIRALALQSQDLAAATAPVLTVHGRLDRSSAYGGGRDWARLLPNARLLTIANAAHAPWVEARDEVLGAIDTFLDGAWPPRAERVESEEPQRTDGRP
jgi:pimeloyl-ACP methyl ester carboxylesterase